MLGLPVNKEIINMHGNSVNLIILIPGKFCFWREIFAMLKGNRDSSFRCIFWSFSYTNFGKFVKNSHFCDHSPGKICIFFSLDNEKLFFTWTEMLSPWPWPGSNHSSSLHWRVQSCSWNKWQRSPGRYTWLAKLISPAWNPTCPHSKSHSWRELQLQDQLTVTGSCSLPKSRSWWTNMYPRRCPDPDM